MTAREYASSRGRPEGSPGDRPVGSQIDLYVNGREYRSPDRVGWAIDEFYRGIPFLEIDSHPRRAAGARVRAARRAGHTYLDYTAGGLYAISQVERHLALLREHVFGNPHSTNPTSSLTMEFIGRAAARCCDSSTPRPTSGS